MATEYMDDGIEFGRKLGTFVGVPSELLDRTIAMEVRTRVGHRPVVAIEYVPAVGEAPVVGLFAIIPLSDPPPIKANESSTHPRINHQGPPVRRRPHRCRVCPVE